MATKKPERLYLLLAINDRTKKSKWLTPSLLTHAEACAMKSKFNPHADVRIMLVQAVRS